MDARMSDTGHDSERYPTLSEQGRRTLEFMREHPCAPIYRNTSGNRLLSAEVEELRGFERTVRDATIGWPQGGVPPWLARFMADTFASVPHYRKLGSAPLRLQDVPPVSRADLAADIAQFVPDHVDLARLINFRTTGTTGHPLLIASHPLVAGRYLAYHKRALRRFGIEPTYGSGQIGVVLLGHQRTCFTYVSVTPTMNESGLAKINLHPDDWRDPADRARYLDALAPEIIAGDPISFAEYLTLPLTTRPRAILSVSMMLLPGMRQQLEQRFGCPVLDIYSLNEVGPVGVFDEAAGGHLLLQERLFVEILDADGRAVARGERGEITLTGGFNFCLPLLRYRTGDHGALRDSPDGPVIVGLSGRTPVRFRTERGWINNIDISHALQRLAIPHFAFHQQADGAVVLRLTPSAMALSDAATAALAPLFGSQAIRVETLNAHGKTMQYTSDLLGIMS
jgi:phenylacetate-CoA ligase